MDTDDSFQKLMRRVRAGDSQAAAELVRLYEPEIRRAIRIHLTDARLRRILDSVDIWQSVVANFFIRVSAGQFELDTPEQLLRLLVTMARNHLRNQLGKHRAQRRDVRRLQEGTEILDAIADPQATPSEVAGGKELMEEVRRRLTAEERFVAEQRAAGRPWSEIAAEVGASPEALRKKLARAMDRVARHLGLDEMRQE